MKYTYEIISYYVIFRTPMKSGFYFILLLQVAHIGMFYCIWLFLGYCMECYVCRNQEGNRDKCVKTSMQCLQDEDTCLTNISYTG